MNYSAKERFDDAVPAEPRASLLNELAPFVAAEQEPKSQAPLAMPQCAEKTIIFKDDCASSENLKFVQELFLNAARDVEERLFGNKGSYPDIQMMSARYLAAADRELTAISFGLLCTEGAKLASTVSATKADIENGNLPSFAAELKEALSSLLDLHSMYVHSIEAAGNLVNYNQTVVPTVITAQADLQDAEENGEKVSANLITPMCPLRSLELPLSSLCA